MEKQMIKKLQDKRSNKKWTAKEIQDLLQFKSQGFNNSEIGAYLQRSEKAIDLKMSKLRTAIKGAGVKVDDPSQLINSKPYKKPYKLPKLDLRLDAMVDNEFQYNISERRIELSKQEKMEKTIAKLTWVIWVGAICGVFWIGTMVGKIL